MCCRVARRGERGGEGEVESVEPARRDRMDERGPSEGIRAANDGARATLDQGHVTAHGDWAAPIE